MPKKMEIHVKERGTAQTTRRIKDLDRSTQSVIKTAWRLAAAYVGIQTVRMGVTLARQAAIAEDVSKAFYNLADSAGIAGDEILIRMRKATAGTIADMKLMQEFSSAALLGLPLERFDEMLTIARGAAKATGQSMEYMLTSVVTGLGRQSKLMLDNLGILIDTQGAYNEYAAALGRTTAQLTDEEKKLAFVNKALDTGAANLAKMGDMSDAASDKYEALKASAANLAIELGNKLDPVIGRIAIGLKASADAITNLLAAQDITPIQKQIDAQYKLLDSYQANREFWEAEEPIFAFRRKRVEDQIERYSRLESNVIDLLSALLLMRDAEDDLTESSKEQSEATEAQIELMGNLITKYRDMLPWSAQIQEGLITESALIRSNAEYRKHLIERMKEQNKVQKDSIKLTMESAIAIGASSSSIMEAVRNTIKAYIAQSIAGQIKDYLAMIPPPFNLVAAATGAAAVSSLFDKLIPKFGAGGEIFVTKPTLVMMGERGPEKGSFVPQPGPQPPAGNIYNFFMQAPIAEDWFRNEFMPLWARIQATG